MKKKIAYLLVLLALAVGLVACGAGQETAAPTEAPPVAVEEVVEEPTAEPEATAEPAVEEPEPVASPEEEVAQEEEAAAAEEAPAAEAVVVQPPPMPDPDLLPIELLNMYVDDLPVEGWGKTYVQGAALDPAMGPSNNGFPPSVFVDFSSPGDAVIPDPKAIFTMDVPQGRVFPVSHYLAMYQEGGSDYAQNAVSSLQMILDERPQTLDETLLTLPGFGDAQQGVRGKPTYFDFPGGSGVGFVAGYGREIGPLLNDTLVYQFVGLTETHSDTPYGTQYISFVFPLEANFMSDLENVTADEIAAAEADLEAYLANKAEQINSAADSDFTPDLAALIAAMQTISIGAGDAAQPPEEETAQEDAVAVQPPPMDDPSLMPIEQFEMYVDDLPVEGWGKTLAAGAALDPQTGPSNNGFPPFVFIDFSSPGDAVIPDPKAIFTMDVPQGRIFAVAPYLAMYDEGGRDYAQEAVSGLQQILDERPEMLDEKLLTLPGFGDAQQGVRGKPTYIDFPGGSGMGFVAGYGQEIGPLLDDTLIYQFVGLTETHSDTPFGTQYISFVFPLKANFLSDLESVTEEEIAEAEADLNAYLAAKTEQIVNAADTDFTPDLSGLITAMQSITIGAEE